MKENASLYIHIQQEEQSLPEKDTFLLVNWFNVFLLVNNKFV